MNMRATETGLRLRPWAEVAAAFSKKTGQRMTTQGAHNIGTIAERKLVMRLINAGLSPYGRINMKWKNYTNREIANDLVENVGKGENGESAVVVCGVELKSPAPRSDAERIKQALIELLDDVRAARE
jgi:hypothetical protein